MWNTREMIRFGLYPSLATASTAALIGIVFQLDAALSNGAHLAQWAKNHNSCVFRVTHATTPSRSMSIGTSNIATAVHYCNGGE